MTSIEAKEEPPVAVTSPAVTNTSALEVEEAVVDLPRWYPHWRGDPIFYGNPEALGWALDSIGRSVSVIGAGAFLGTALLRLARLEVGCPTEPPPGSNKVPECDERVHGLFRPSSLLTTYTIVVGVASACVLPIMGAVVDYTPHRRLVGRWLCAWLLILMFPQIFITENSWFAIALLQIGVAFVGWAETMVTHSYLPELTDSKERLSVFTQSFTILTFGSMVLYLAGVVALSAILGLGDVDTARVGMAIAFGVTSATLYPAWRFLFQKRPATHVLPPQQSLWTVGFVQVWRSSRYIYHNLPALKWFYIAIALVDGAVGSLATIMITYLTDTLNFSSCENGVAILLMLIGSIPGALIAGRIIHQWNPIIGCISATLLMGINTVVAAIVLKEPGQYIATYVLASIWGMGTGWKWTSDRVLVSSILPTTGQDAELMGLYLFFSQVLTWLPPLIFTGLNEAGVDQRVGIGSISIFFFLGTGALLSMGSYQEAVAVAGRMVESGDEQQSNAT